MNCFGLQCRAGGMVRCCAVVANAVRCGVSSTQRLADREAPALLRKIERIGDFYIAIKWKFTR